MNDDPFSSFGGGSSFGSNPSSSFGTSSMTDPMNSTMNNSSHNDAHAFATSMMTGFPIDGSLAAITGATMHNDTSRHNSNMFNSSNSSKFTHNTAAFVNKPKYCKHCGNEVNITANYCKHCGKEL